MTRKIAALVAAAALGLSACASPDSLDGTQAAETSTTPTHMTTETPEPRTVEPVADAATEEVYDFQADIAEQAYMDTVAPYTYPSKEDALMVGYATCALLNTGSTPATLAAELMFADDPVVPGFLNDELPHFYGAAMGSLCPEYGKKYFG